MGVMGGGWDVVGDGRWGGREEGREGKVGRWWIMNLLRFEYHNWHYFSPDGRRR